MAIAKALGGGFPVGACLATAEAGQGMTVGSHGSTYGGNPLAMAVGLAAMEELNSPELLAHVREVAGYFTQQLSGLQERFPDVVEDIRGKGLLIGIELVTFSSCRSLMVATIPYTPLPPVNVEPAPRLVGLAETTRSPEIRLRLYPPVT